LLIIIIIIIIIALNIQAEVHGFQMASNQVVLMPYSQITIWVRAGPGLLAVSLQSHIPDGRTSLLSTQPVVTCAAAEDDQIILIGDRVTCKKNLGNIPQ